MADAALFWHDYGGDIQVQDGDLIEDNGLISAVLLSLYVDRRASIEQLTDEEADPRGYWADTEEDRHGSLLWLLHRQKITNEIIERSRAYVEEALEWMVFDGVAEKVIVEAERAGIYAIQIKVQILQGPETQYQHLWNNMETASLKIGLTTIEIEFL